MGKLVPAGTNKITYRKQYDWNLEFLESLLAGSEYVTSESEVMNGPTFGNGIAVCLDTETNEPVRFPRKARFNDALSHTLNKMKPGTGIRTGKLPFPSGGFFVKAASRMGHDA